MYNIMYTECALKNILDKGDHVERIAGTRKDLPVGNLLYEGPEGGGAATDDQRLLR